MRLTSEKSTKKQLFYLFLSVSFFALVAYSIVILEFAAGPNGSYLIFSQDSGLEQFMNSEKFRRVCTHDWSSSSNVWILESMLRTSLPTLLQCTLESYATHYPESCVRVLYLHPQSNMPLLKSDLSKFLKRHFLNIDVVHMTTEELLKDTPAEQLLPNISRARYHAVHRSDIARIALIYKYGGVYSDADIILRRKPNFGPKFFTRSGASSLLINAAFAYPKGDSILWNALYELKKTYDPKGYTVMYTHNKVTERFCKSSCDNTARQFDNNTVNFKCCDMTIVASVVGQCGRSTSEEEIERKGCTFYHYSRSYNCINAKRSERVEKNIDLRFSTSTLAKIGRQSCPVVVKNSNFFNITCEDVT